MCVLVCLMLSHKSLNFLHFFSFFSFCSSDWTIFNDLILVYRFLFRWMQIFKFNYYILQLHNFCFIHLFFLFPCLNSHLFLNSSPDIIFITIILNYLSGNLCISVSLCLFSGGWSCLICSFFVSSLSLTHCVGICTLEKNSHLFHFSQTALIHKKTLMNQPDQIF